MHSALEWLLICLYAGGIALGSVACALLVAYLADRYTDE